MDIVGNFIGEYIAPDVLLNTSVSGVGSLTRLPNAHNQSSLQDKGKNLMFPTAGALPTPVLVEKLAFYLEGYDAKISQELVAGFVYGFRLHFQGTQQGQFSSNLQSALQNPEIVDRKLAKEICEGRIRGPFVQPPFYNLKVSPLGVIPKKQPGEYRMIHHLSFPSGGSVNDFIPSELCSVHYASVDDAVKMIKKLGPNCHLAKTDVRSAFRIIPVNPADYYLLGMHWKGNYYVDCCLPMGLASSCRTFEILSTALEWVARNKLNIPHIIHILDDFLIAAESFDTCKTSLHQFLTFCENVGVPMAPEKTEGPSPFLTFAGIELDCSMNEARLPQEKVEKCLLAIHSLLGRKKVTLKELQSLIGLLNFACSVVTPGRVFLRRLINLTIGIKQSHHFIRLTTEVKRDLRIWDTFMSSFNGKSFFLEDDWASSYSLRFYTDSAQSSGYGLIFGTQWAYGTWPDSWKDHHISFLEFFPIVLGLCLWCSQLKNKRVVFITDNESIVYIINKQTAKDPKLLSLLRTLVLICLRNNILFRARHIKGARNILADSLSRLQVDKFRALAPGMNPEPTPLPVQLLPKNWEIL